MVDEQTSKNTDKKIMKKKRTKVAIQKAKEVYKQCEEDHETK